MRGITSLFTVAPLPDGAGGYLFALILRRDLPRLERGEFHTYIPQAFSVPKSRIFR